VGPEDFETVLTGSEEVVYDQECQKQQICQGESEQLLFIYPWS